MRQPRRARRPSGARPVLLTRAGEGVVALGQRRQQPVGWGRPCSRARRTRSKSSVSLEPGHSAPASRFRICPTRPARLESPPPLAVNEALKAGVLVLVPLCSTLTLASLSGTVARDPADTAAVDNDAASASVRKVGPTTLMGCSLGFFDWTSARPRAGRTSGDRQTVPPASGLDFSWSLPGPSWPHTRAHCRSCRKGGKIEASASSCRWGPTCRHDQVKEEGVGISGGIRALSRACRPPHRHGVEPG